MATGHFPTRRCYLSFGKPLLDMFLGVSAGVVSAPIIGGVALLVARKLGTPVLFKQTRPGLHGAPFTIYKFRTMTEARDSTGQLLSDAERLTPFGEFLRRTSFDELPEILNVIRGDMSLVGPRPLLMRYLPLYSKEQARRHDVKPGITGWAQINGRNDIDWKRKLELDVWYVDNVSFLLDLEILFATIHKVLKRDGISKQGEATTTEFLGNDGE